MQTKNNVINVETKPLYIFSFVVAAVYVLSIFLLCQTRHVSFNELIVLNPTDHSTQLASILIKLVTLASATALLMLPGIIWTISVKNEFKNFLSFFATTFAVSLLVLIFSSIIFKLITPYIINRTTLLAIIFIELSDSPSRFNKNIFK